MVVQISEKLKCTDCDCIVEMARPGEMLMNLLKNFIQEFLAKGNFQTRLRAPFKANIETRKMVRRWNR